MSWRHVHLLRGGNPLITPCICLLNFTTIIISWWISSDGLTMEEIQKLAITCLCHYTLHLPLHKKILKQFNQHIYRFINKKIQKASCMRSTWIHNPHIPSEAYHPAVLSKVLILGCLKLLKPWTIHEGLRMEWNLAHHCYFCILWETS